MCPVALNIVDLEFDVRGDPNSLVTLSYHLLQNPLLPSRLDSTEVIANYLGF